MGLHRFFDSPNGHFVRHYVEMVVAMVAGMLLLGLPAEGAVLALGSTTSELERQAPALMLLGMAVVMTVPMIAWMRHRGHGWAASWEMTASMFLPTFAAIALLWGGVLESGHTAMGIQHVIMFPAMLAAMFLRLDEYTGHHA